MQKVLSTEISHLGCEWKNSKPKSNSNIMSPPPCPSRGVIFYFLVRLVHCLRASSESAEYCTTDSIFRVLERADQTVLSSNSEFIKCSDTRPLPATIRVVELRSDPRVRRLAAVWRNPRIFRKQRRTRQRISSGQCLLRLAGDTVFGHNFMGLPHNASNRNRRRKSI